MVGILRKISEADFCLQSALLARFGPLLAEYSRTEMGIISPTRLKGEDNYNSFRFHKSEGAVLRWFLNDGQSVGWPSFRKLVTDLARESNKRIRKAVNARDGNVHDEGWR